MDAEGGAAPKTERSGFKLYRYRRWFQVASALLFFGLLTLTVWPLGSVFLGAFLVADPLFALNSAVNGVLRAEMLLALAMLAAPLLLGRAFCGYACPLGLIVELTSPKRDRTGPAWLRDVPALSLMVVLGLLLFGSAIFLVLDPLSLVTRSAVTLVYPLLDRVTRLVGDVMYVAPPLRPYVDGLTTALAGRIVFARPLAFRLSFLVLVMFAILLTVSWVERRLWCRHLCPLGALLGQVSRIEIVGRVVDDQACIRCGKCRRACPMGAIGEDPTATDATRCQMGFECGEVCPSDAVRLRVGPRKANHSPERRALITAGALGLLGGFFIFTRPGRSERDARLVRPPGSVPETSLLALCSRCGQCMKVCPTNVIQPSVSAAGLEGVFTPQMDFERGYCDWACHECGKVCPTGAIRPLSLAAKRRTVIGRAYIDKNRCIPWTDFKDCIVCEELCPIPDKAIVFDVQRVRAPSGALVTLKRPVVLAERCIGCGICERNCPVAYEAAILVRATETPRRS